MIAHAVAEAAADPSGPVSDHGFTGLTGFAADVLTALGDVGVGVLVFVEVLIPPIPSEVILPFAGYLTQSGDLSLVPLILWSTLASVVGALLWYGLGRWIGLERAVRFVEWTRLVSRADLDRGVAWFHKYETWSVLIGRLIPGVRSLISIPAGADRMPLWSFIGLTAIGSGVWNALLIGLGALLGRQHDVLEQWLGYLDLVVYAALAAFVIWLIVRRVRAGRATS
ncbi:DedA family protein [Agromyces protaetiae]|uniref:DedA family protein n=1 Tax=Agromyces protaetiae TaxID=2509455 RepID=A0A4P6FAS8_9MICO|nr:DedA family protein [Agromyces protaetiae]QAY72914.1 DedA family protein [Agromyces protaetiae]